MKLLMENWQRFINEATEFDEHFERLFKSGPEGIKQAVEFARSLGVPTQDLPWGPDSIYQFVNPENRGMMQYDFRKLVDAQEEVTGWGFDKYDSAVADMGDARQVASGEVSPEEMAKYHGMEVDSDEWAELWASWQKYIQPYLAGDHAADWERTGMWEQKLNEATTLEKDLKGGFRQAIEDSQFWTLANAEGDVDLGDHSDEMTTPASEALRIALNEKAQELNTDLHFIVTVSSEYVLSKDDPYGGYPNNWMKHGMYQGPTKGAHVIWIELRPLGEDYKPSEMDPSKLVGIVSRTLNHELVHYKQLKRQVEAKGISEEEAWEELLCDPEQIPVPQDPTKRAEWAERCGKEPPEQDPGRGTYLSRHSEIDAYAHEAAEQLIDKYGAQEALQLIKQRDSDVIGVLADYRKVFNDDRETMKKFLKKLYSQIIGK